jgi:drug/metabolite transporter (DMT)-like permease
MRGRPKLGAAIGFCLGLALTGLLVLVPAARRNSFYEVGDALLVLGVPLLVAATSIGAMIGLAVNPSPHETPPPMERSTAILILVGVIVYLLAMWLFLRGTGLLDILG